ncbi:MAG: hypothetical protein AABX85_04435 [Nanoarchaeota archaeon]
MNYLYQQGYIPLSKSWIIRMGFLDTVNGYDDGAKFLKNQENLGEDLEAMLRVSRSWLAGERVLDVGESGTVYRFFRFYTWKNEIPADFEMRKTLKDRPINNDSSIVNLPLAQLRRSNLDNGTTQWQSAAILAGNTEKLDNPEPEVALTYKAIKHWKEKRANGQRWDPRPDPVILGQAQTFLRLLNKTSVEYIPPISEGYCFARAFGYMTKAEGESKWPKLRGHESDRLAEMETQLKNYETGKEISSKDHRVVQALAMKAKIDGKEVVFSNPNCVKKTWVRFWDFLKDSEKLLKTNEFFID